MDRHQSRPRLLGIFLPLQLVAADGVRSRAIQEEHQDLEKKKQLGSHLAGTPSKVVGGQLSKELLITIQTKFNSTPICKEAALGG